MNSRNVLLLLLCVIVLSVIGGRLSSRKAAADFGSGLSGAFSMLNDEGLADTRELKAFFAGPEMKEHRNTVKRFAILGGGYDERIDEVEKGLIYLSEQMALPRERRFARIPRLRHFRISPEITTERGVFDAATKLILDYRRQIL